MNKNKKKSIPKKRKHILWKLNEEQRKIYVIFWATLILGLLSDKVRADFLDDDDTYQNSDFNYSDDEESPGDHHPPPPPSKSTSMPYFDLKTKTTYGKYGDRIMLECPVKNFNESEHEILWFKEGNPITNGRESLHAGLFSVGNNRSLIIEKLDKETTGNYYCNVLPQKVRSHILVKIGTGTSTGGGSGGVDKTKKGDMVEKEDLTKSEISATSSPEAGSGASSIQKAFAANISGQVYCVIMGIREWLKQ